MEKVSREENETVCSLTLEDSLVIVHLERSRAGERFLNLNTNAIVAQNCNKEANRKKS